ncbi:MAG: 23S rRNA (uracil(1939)-C(5))-methyltransferase RlmD [Deltaproteobacteria bacterium]|nr:23S rRNA (uracil(1939)-C(5))-methyltransferase RlmD [Deltaproteobacteria bacterium]
MTSTKAGGTHPHPGDELSVTVERLAYGGVGVARFHGLTVFVRDSVPGERVRARVRRVFRRHVEAEPIAIESPSPHRVPPRCRHVGDACGGCTWQHVSYAAQLAAKADAVRDSLERLGGLRDLPLLPILPAPDEFHYRNKMEFAFHPDGILGLHPREAWYEIIPLRECLLAPPLMMSIVQAARRFVEVHGISLYHPRTRQGLLRDLCVRHGRGTGEVLLGLVTSPGAFPEAEAMAAHLADVDPCIKGVVRSIRRAPDGAAPPSETQLLHGRDHITEVVADLRFRIRVDTFFQTNSAQAERLVEVVMGLAGDVAGAQVVDVYSGVGLFSLALAAAGAHVLGVEVVGTAVEDARRNAAQNGLATLTFHAGDARKVLAEVLPAGLGPKVLLLDPPRAGAGGKVMRRVARAGPERILYVSCNPTTLARDLVELRPFGYRITAVQPLDLFPQTYHVETVVALERGTAPTTDTEKSTS